MASVTGRYVAAQGISLRAATYRLAIRLAGKGLLWPLVAGLTLTIVIACILVGTSLWWASAEPSRPVEGQAAASAAHSATAPPAPPASTPESMAMRLATDGYPFTGTLVPGDTVVQLAVQHDEEPLDSFLTRVDALPVKGVLMKVAQHNGKAGQRWLALLEVKFPNTEQAWEWCEKQSNLGRECLAGIYNRL